MFLIALLSALQILLLFASFNCLSVHASTLYLLLAHHHLCYVEVYCACTIKQLFYILFLNYIILCPLYIVSVNNFYHHVFPASSVFV